MRIYVLLIFAAITLSFSTAYYAFNLQNKSVAGDVELAEILKYKDQFSRTHKKLFEIDLSAMYPSRKYAQLLQAPSSFTKDTGGSKTFFSRPCESAVEKMSKAISGKSEVWEDFRCNRIKELPEDFFEKSPLVHENGLSYAFLAFLSGRAPFYQNEWVRSNLNLFHINELEDLPTQGLEGNFKILSKIKKPDIESLVEGNEYVLDEMYFFVRNKKGLSVTYRVFSKNDFENFMEDKNYFLRDHQPGIQCFYKEGSFCFEKGGTTFVHLFMESSLFIFAFSVVVLILVALILFKKIKQQNFEEERKKHALRVLTHELRTPIANLLLQVEQINKHSDEIPPHALDEFLKMEGEVYRLKRLAEKSTSYLQTHDGTSLLSISVQEVPSVNELIMDLLHDYLAKGVKAIPSNLDHSFFLDVYWFDICIKNLVENALHHGSPPVTIRWTVTPTELWIHVIDQGSCPYKNLDEITNTDRTGKNSRGLGLGMNIVQKIMREMGGKLVYNSKPTTFSLFLRNKK